jgi:hypothetical protein
MYKEKKAVQALSLSDTILRQRILLTDVVHAAQFTRAAAAAASQIKR